MLAILHVLLSKGQISIGTYDKWRRRTRGIVLLALLVSFVAVFFNAMGWFWVNATIGFVFAWAALTFAAAPKFILGVAGAGAVFHPLSPLTGIKEIETAYLRMVGGVVLWIGFFCLVLSTVQLSRNWSALPVLYLALLIVFLTDAVWGISLFFSRSLVSIFSIIVLIFYFGSMISAPTWKKVTGVDPFAYIRLSPTEILVSDLEDQLAENQEKTDAETLKDYLAKAKTGTPLNADELAFVAEQRTKAEGRSLPGMLKTTSASISSATEQPYSLSRGRHEFQLKAGETSEPYYFQFGDSYSIDCTNFPYTVIAKDGKEYVVDRDGYPLPGGLDPFRVRAGSTDLKYAIIVGGV